MINYITHVHKVKNATLKRIYITIQITTIPGTTYHHHHPMFHLHHLHHRLQGRQLILQGLHYNRQSTTKLISATTTTAAGVSPNILPLHFLHISSTTILLLSTFYKMDQTGSIEEYHLQLQETNKVVMFVSTMFYSSCIHCYHCSSAICVSYGY